MDAYVVIEPPCNERNYVSSDGPADEDNVLGRAQSSTTEGRTHWAEGDWVERMREEIRPGGERRKRERERERVGRERGGEGARQERERQRWTEEEEEDYIGSESEVKERALRMHGINNNNNKNNQGNRI
jgi:hypothetical protein